MPVKEASDLSARLQSFFVNEERQLRDQISAADRREMKANAIAAALEVDKDKAELLNMHRTASAESVGGNDGNVQLLNLQIVAEIAGTQSAGMLAKVHRIIETVLASRLLPQEPFFRYGDCQYILVFDTTDEEDARRRCRSLEELILRKLLGEDGVIRGLDLPPVTGPADARVPPSPVPSLAAIVEQLTRQAEADARPRSAEPSDPVKHRLDRLLGLLGQIAGSLSAHQVPGEQESTKAAALERIDRTTKLARDAARAMATGDGQAAAIDQDHVIGLLEQSLSKIHQDMGQLGLAVGTPFEPEPKRPAAPAGESDWGQSELSLSYLPVWQVKKQAISTFVCGITSRTGSTLDNLEPLIAAEEDPSLVAAVDRLLLLKAIAELRSALEINRRYIIIVPVHYSSLSKKNLRQQYLSTCATLGEDCRPYLIFELVYPFVGVSNLPVINAISLIKPYARAVFLRVGIDYPDFTDLAGAGTFSAGTDLGESGITEIELAAKINSFQSRIERAKLRSHLYGVGTLSLASVAIGAGADFLGGSAVASPLHSLDGMQEYQLTNLFRRHGVFGAN